MSRAPIAKKLAQNLFLYLGLAVLMVAAVPVLAGLAWGVRLLIPVLLLAVGVAALVSPMFRRWLMDEADSSPHYHGVAVPGSSLWLHPAHAWANVELSGEASIGVDALALAALGTITGMELPTPGSTIAQGQTLFTLAHGARHLRVRAPISGVVAEINEAAAARPALLERSPYDRGWVVRLQDVELDKERAALRHGTALRQWWRGEVDRFIQRLSAGAALPSMADGGLLCDGIANHLDEAKWREIASELFGQEAG